MNNMPLLEEVLAEDWDKLPKIIQRHYCAPSCVKGTMEVGYPNFLWPLIYLIHCCGGLVLKRGEQIKTQVKKTQLTEGGRLNWQRTLEYSDHNKDYFYSQMFYSQPYELIEKVRFGFGLRLSVAVDNGSLIYKSCGHLWQCGNLRVNFPDWFLLGQATIIETPISDQQFKLNFTIQHPLWGVSYWYRGMFEYCDDEL